MTDRPDIPLGTTHDAKGRELTFKDSDGFWREHTRDAQGRMLTFKNSKGYWHEYTYDDKGRGMTFKDSAGYWREHTYDAHGRVLTYKNSNGYWYEFTYDADGRELTFKQEGFSGVRIADDGEYELLHDAERGLFLAGCRRFTRAEALKHWNRDDERAKLFTKAIQEAV